MAHRKTVRHFHEVGHLHELTFSCYQRMPLLTNDAWREKLARCVDAAGKETAIDLVGFVFMPEHVHLLVYPTAPNPSISRLSGPNQAAVLEADQRHLGRARLSVVAEAHGDGTAGEDVLSVLARRARLRSKSVLSRSHLVILGVHPQQPGQTRALSMCRGLEMVVGQVLSRCTSTTTASRFAADSRFAGRSPLLTGHPTSTGRASGTQSDGTGRASGTQPVPFRRPSLTSSPGPVQDGSRRAPGHAPLPARHAIARAAARPVPDSRRPGSWFRPDRRPGCTAPGGCPRNTPTASSRVRGPN